MLGREWRRRTAKTVLMAFGASCMACGGSPTEQAPPTSTSTLATPTTVMSMEAPEGLDDAELRELVAPVALYPDVVLASLLPATTYPEDLHEAAQWLGQRDGTVEAVPEDRDWDGSVAGLLQFPDVLVWADENEPWTDEMGTAMTYQQGDVLDAIQSYRAEVAKVGNLESNEYQKVVHAGDEIRIEPAQPETVYVPQYDTVAATQPQPAGQGINPWIAFGGGAVVGALGAWALYSIFDDDDDDHGHRKVKKVNNYYYSGSGRRRPRAEAWTPQRRTQAQRPRRRPRRADAFEPKPIKRTYTKERRGTVDRGTSGVRPPGHRRSPAPAVATQPAATDTQRVGKTQGAARKQGAGKKQGTVGTKQGSASATKQDDAGGTKQGNVGGKKQGNAGGKKQGNAGGKKQGNAGGKKKGGGGAKTGKQKNAGDAQ